VRPFPLFRAAADYDFRGNRYSGPALTCARASVGYIDDNSGNWTLIAANTLRRSNKGLLVEGAQSNLVLYCGDLTNAVWNKTSATSALTQTGFDGVANSASLMTATAANGQITQSITSVSMLRTTSIFLKRITGAGAVQITQDGATWLTVTPSASWQRFTLPSVTAANPIVGVRLATAGDAVAVDCVQNETWQTYITTVGGASSPIRTTATAVTREADYITATLPTALTALTIAGTARTSPIPVASAFFAQADDGTNNNTIRLYRLGDRYLYQPVVAGADTGNSQSLAGTFIDDARVSLAGASDVGSTALSVNTGAGSIAATTAIPNCTRLSVGIGAGNYWFGYIERLSVLSYRMANANLQALSRLVA
jgi:hypothetical protein